MKRLLIGALAVIVFAYGCSAPKNAGTVTATPTVTPFIVQSLPSKTPVPTKTPVIVAPTPDSMIKGYPFYMVKDGDTLTGISEKVGVSTDDLMKLNGIKNPNRIWAGQVLMLRSKEEILQMAYAEPGRKVIVILAEQKAYAVENGNVVKTFIVSTGVNAYPTILGRYPIYVKFLFTRMTGPGYDLPDVPYVMYFYKGYGLHGTYWHHNFGHPMSHGCVNMQSKPVNDAKWLYNWVTATSPNGPGTPVWVVP